MAQLGKNLTLFALLALATCTPNTPDLDGNPQILVLIDDVGAPTTGCVQLVATGGLAPQTHKLTVTNTGTLGALCLTKATFTPTATKLLSLTWDPHMADASACPGAFASLPPGQSLNAKLVYTPSPGLTDTATLALVHNDYQDPSKYAALCLAIGGAAVTVTPATLVFTNPKASAPQQQCVEVGNAGDLPLTFTALAEVKPASPEYAITQEPAVGTVIPPLGAPGNPTDKPTTVQVCVQMTSDGNAANDAAALVIHTDDPQTPDVDVALQANYPTPSSFTLKCALPNGALGYSFQGKAAGTQQTCTLHNDGPAALAWNGAPTLMALQPSQPAEVDAAYALTLQLNGQELPKPWTAGSIAAGDTLGLTLTYTPLASALAPWATVVLTYAQNTDLGTVPLSVIGSCTFPTLQFSADDLWLHAVPGQKTQASLVVANQGCGPVDVLKACINNASAKPSMPDPCASAAFASKTLSLVPSVGASTLAPSASSGGNGLLSLSIAFQPTTASAPDGLLNVVYCVSGSIAGGDCKPGTTTMLVTGDTTNFKALPTAQLALATLTPTAGAPCRVTGTLTPGDLPDGHTWRWALTARPAGSAAWLDSAEQATTDPSVQFVPDVKGSYTLQASALTQDPNDASHVAWTAPAPLTIVVP